MERQKLNSIKQEIAEWRKEGAGCDFTERAVTLLEWALSVIEAALPVCAYLDISASCAAESRLVKAFDDAMWKEEEQHG